VNLISFAEMKALKLIVHLESDPSGNFNPGQGFVLPYSQQNLAVDQKQTILMFFLLLKDTLDYSL